MSQLSIYNSLTREKEVFTPITPGHVGLYVCGPTVSGESHLGHARPYITFDVVNRYLQFLNYKVRYVRNITDAGHFEEEGRDATDKVNDKAKLEQLEPMELVHKYTNLFHWGMRAFNTLEPSIEPTATGHIIEQISMIKKIIEKGYAYEVNGSVYFDVKKYAANYPYGKLSGRILDDLLETTRELDGQDEKRNKVDFALWKAAPPEHIMRWESPWGEGFPGWHIECTAIALEYLDPSDFDDSLIDIQGGGSDLIFPHHEMCAAQAHVITGKQLASTYVHSGMIGLDGEKMSKSKGNLVFVSRLVASGVDPMAIRWALMSDHYRADRMWSDNVLHKAQLGVSRLKEALGKNNCAPTKELINSIVIALSDDLDTPHVLSLLNTWSAATLSGAEGGNSEELVIALDALLGLKL